MGLSKQELRECLKQSRFSMGDDERIILSRHIVERLKDEIDWSEVKTVHYFEPIRRLLEVDVSDLVVHLEDSYPDIRLFTPRNINGEWEMVSIKDGPLPGQFDVIIVPMLGFDSKLNRIGWGGGFYDKFLATQPKAKKIGVCFEAGKIDQIPAESYDVPMDLIVTEDKVHHL
jgi:5-formyltetrahydrofolate cyclo-ligase